MGLSSSRPRRSRDHRYIRYGYALGLVGAVAALSLVLARLKYGSAFFDQSVYTIGFGFGPLVENLVEEGWYGVRWRECEMIFRAHRLPALPVVLAAAAAIDASLWFAYAFKNVLVAGLYAAALWPFVQRVRRFYLACGAAFAVTFLSPLTAIHATAVEYEEGITYVLLLAGVAGILRRTPAGAWGAAAAAVALLLAKGTLLAGSAVLAGFAGYRLYQTHSRWAGVLVVALYASALLGWGIAFAGPTHGLAVGSDMSSWNGLNLYLGNHPKTSEVYPGRSLDQLQGTEVFWSRDVDGNCFGDEWTAHRYYLNRAHTYVATHPWETAQRWGERLYLSTLRITDWDEGGVPVWPSLLLLRLLFFGALGIALWDLGNGTRPEREEALLVVLLSGACIAPFVAGFVYPRHVTILQALAIPFLMSRWGDWTQAPSSPNKDLHGTEGKTADR